MEHLKEYHPLFIYAAALHTEKDQIEGFAPEYFRTGPYACDPSRLPKYSPSKEIDVKAHDNTSWDRWKLMYARHVHKIYVMGLIVVGRMWAVPEIKGISRSTRSEDEKLKLATGDCHSRMDKAKESKEFYGEVLKTHQTVQVVQDSILTSTPISDDVGVVESTKRRKYLMVIGDKLKKLEDKKGIIMRFVIGHSATPGGILDRAIKAEEKKHGDFLRLAAEDEL
ncbi:hypothetical protein AgCh_004191 [Apium graveolens]